MSEQASSKKVINAWAMYDWANSVFSLTIATAIFPIYFEAITANAALAEGSAPGGPYYITLLGCRFINTALYSYAVSVGFFIAALISPILSGIADVKRSKLNMLRFFCYLGSLSCASLYFFDTSTIPQGVLAFILSMIGFAGSLVFYNAFLPEITTPDKFDVVSARGFSFGYIGSVLLLLINLATIMFPQFFFPIESKIAELQTLDPHMTRGGAEFLAKSYYESIATRISFITVGVWWAGFAQITFRNLPEERLGVAHDGNILAKGYQELRKVWNEAKKEPSMTRFLIGFFFTSMGVQTVMYVASLFGSHELKLDTSKLILTILIVQLIAIAGATFFSRLSKRIGNIYTLVITILIWIVICVFAYFVSSETGFYMLGALVGVVMGGIQSMFRSTYAKLIPVSSQDHASYFSFFDVCEKMAIVLGTFTFGLLQELTGGMRNSVLALTVFFIVGLFFISRIRRVFHEG